jgi:hypothetical protein
MDILCKNPDTDMGLYLKSLKNGHVVGNIVDKHYYEIVFQDEKYSYLPEESNQIDYQSYCAPLATLHICNELFTHILKSRDEYSNKTISWLNRTQGEIDTEPCCIEVPSLYIDSKWFRGGRFLLSKYFDGIAVEQQTNRIFKLTVSAPSIFEAFNLFSLVSLFTHITNDYGIYTYIDDNLAQKYGRVLSNIRNVPYFVFYLFFQRAVKSENQFNELKPLFEKYLLEEGLQVDFQWQGTKQQRIQYIFNQLEMDIPVLDIGCGEFDFYKKVMKHGFKEQYYAVDKDERIETLCRNIAKRYEENNLSFYSSLDEFSSNEKLNILLVEVIEHNSIDDAKALIRKAIEYNFNKLIITTPNIEFNQYYHNMDSIFRHEDHIFEPDIAEFRAIIEECIANQNKYRIEYFYLGDCINGVQPTQGCIVFSS